jgi:hypothetical protein
MERQPLILNYATRRRIDWQVVIVTAVLPGVVWALFRTTQWIKENGPRRMEIAYQINTNLSEAGAETASGQFSEAQVAVDRARLAASADPTIFLSIEVSEFRRRIDQVDLDLDTAREIAFGKPRSDDELERRIAYEHPEAICIRTDTIYELTNTMRSLMDSGKTQEALQTCDQILILDAQNCEAAHARWLMTSSREQSKK